MNLFVRRLSVKGQISFKEAICGWMQFAMKLEQTVVSRYERGRSRSGSNFYKNRDVQKEAF